MKRRPFLGAVAVGRARNLIIASAAAASLIGVDPLIGNAANLTYFTESEQRSGGDSLTSSAPTYTVNSQCTGAAGVATNLNQATFVFVATAEAASNQTLAPPTSTGVKCVVFDVTLQQTIASFQAGLVGPAAIADRL